MTKSWGGMGKEIPVDYCRVLFFRNLEIQSLSKNRASYLDLENIKLLQLGM